MRCPISVSAPGAPSATADSPSEICSLARAVARPMTSSWWRERSSSRSETPDARPSTSSSSAWRCSRDSRPRCSVTANSSCIARRWSSTSARVSSTPRWIASCRPPPLRGRYTMTSPPARRAFGAPRRSRLRHDMLRDTILSSFCAAFCSSRSNARSNEARVFVLDRLDHVEQALSSLRLRRVLLLVAVLLAHWKPPPGPGRDRVSVARTGWPSFCIGVDPGRVDGLSRSPNCSFDRLPRRRTRAPRPAPEEQPVPTDAPGLPSSGARR